MMTRRYYDDDRDYPRGGSNMSRFDGGPPAVYSHGTPTPYISGAMPVPPPDSPNSARLRYQPQNRLYASNGLEVPDWRSRPRSVPPLNGRDLAMRQSGSRSPSTSSRDRSRSPLGKARHLVKDTFTDSPSGLGVGVLGAIIGGLAAREVSETATRRRSLHHDHSGKPRDHQTSQIVSTLVGAAVGGLGANALERRLENNRVRDREKEQAWKENMPRDGGDRSRGRRRKRGTAADYYDVDHGYDYVYDRRISRRRSDGGLSLD